MRGPCGTKNTRAKLGIKIQTFERIIFCVFFTWLSNSTERKKYNKKSSFSGRTEKTDPSRRTGTSRGILEAVVHRKRARGGAGSAFRGKVGRRPIGGRVLPAAPRQVMLMVTKTFGREKQTKQNERKQTNFGKLRIRVVVSNKVVTVKYPRTLISRGRGLTLHDAACLSCSDPYTDANVRRSCSQDLQHWHAGRPFRRLK